MARRPRILFPGALYHVYNRGNDRHPVFRDDEDRIRYLSYLTKYAHEMSVNILAYCLLENHFHLFLQTLLANLPLFMQRLHSSYAMWYNKKRSRTGHLYTSRYQASLVQRENYGLELSRYIHLNPVRAELVALPEEWPWSSYLHYVGTRKTPFLHAEMVLEEFGHSKEEQQSAYETFVLDGLETGSAWKEPPVKAGMFLGDDKFVEEMCSKFLQGASGLLALLSREGQEPSTSQIMEALLQESGLSPEALRLGGKRHESYWRNMFILLARSLTHASVRELSQFLDLSPSEISRAKHRFESKALTDRQVLEQIEKIIYSLEESEVTQNVKCKA
jgi:REP element-mobilizing transposase RayT